MRKRPHRIYVHLNDGELAFFNRQLAVSGLTMEPYLRRLIQGHEVKQRPSPEYKGLYTEINAIGRNVNQIARKCNEGEDVQQFREEMLFYLSTLYQLLDEHL